MEDRTKMYIYIFTIQYTYYIIIDVGVCLIIVTHINERPQ